MELDEYLIKDESISTKIMAYNSEGEYSESRAGTLACTPYRLVYVNGGDVTDISLQGVNSIEYSEGGYPTEYLLWGLIIGLLGSVLFIFSPIGPLTAEIGFAIGVGAVVLAVGTALYGLMLRDSTISVHTSNKTYNFYAKKNGLDKIAHSVRGHEVDNK